MLISVSLVISGAIWWRCSCVPGVCSDCDGTDGPVRTCDDVVGLAGDGEVERHGGELTRGAALIEQHPVVVRNVAVGQRGMYTARVIQTSETAIMFTFFDDS